MALIDCPECGKQISDKAVSCPHCGNPISSVIEVAKTKNSEVLQFPNLPQNLEIGEKKEMALFRGFYDGNEHVNTRLHINGEIFVTLILMEFNCHLYQDQVRRILRFIIRKSLV